MSKNTNNILRIGIDIDSTILEINTWVFRIIKRGLNIDLKKIPLTYHIEKLPQILAITDGPLFVEKLFKSAFVYETAMPIKGALETLEKWKKLGYFIQFITARPKVLKEITNNWFTKHNLTWAINQTIYMEDFSTDRAQYKNEVAKKLKLEILIDDHAGTLKIADAPTLIKKIGLKYPWNEHEDVGGAELVKTWEEIDQIINLI